MNRQVFNEPTVRRDGPLEMGDPAAAWLLTSSRPEASAGRRLVNDMFARFTDATGRMADDLRSPDERRFFSALDELYVHDKLIQRYQVGYEQGDRTRPDFRLYRYGDLAGSVEVLTLLQRDQWTSEQRRHAQVADKINKRVPLTTHSVAMDIQRWDDQPNLRHLDTAIRQLNDGPGTLPPDDTGMPHSTFISPQAEIHFGYLAESGLATDAGQIVVNGAMTGGVIDSSIRLRDRLDDKAGKYDLHGKPFAIVVGARDPWCDIRETFEALAGTSAVVVATGHATRSRDGFFGTNGSRPQGKRTGVSAVFTLHDWFPGGPYRPRMTRFDNPNAAADFAHDALPNVGHWGVQHQDERTIRATWLVPAEVLKPAA